MSESGLDKLPMRSEIVMRLRRAAKLPIPPVQILEEAANEIERLHSVRADKETMTELLAECYRRLHDNYEEAQFAHDAPPEPANEWSYNIIPTFVAIQRATGKNHGELMDTSLVRGMKPEAEG